MSHDRMKLYQSVYDVLDRIDINLDATVELYTNPAYGGRPLSEEQKKQLGLATDSENNTVVPKLVF